MERSEIAFPVFHKFILEKLVLVYYNSFSDYPWPSAAGSYYMYDAGIYPFIKSNKEDKKMAFKISDACLSCGSCQGECPVGAISEGADQYVIDADACISCGSCAGACPVEAISEE